MPASSPNPSDDPPASPPVSQRRPSHRVDSLWARCATPLRISVFVALVALAAYGVAGLVTRDASFSISARSEVLTLELGCGQSVVWDLPAGQIGAQDLEREPPRSDIVSVAMRGGARARVRAAADTPWMIEFDQSDSFGCAAQGREVITATADTSVLPASAEGYTYRSSRPLGEGERPALLLRGRVVIGDEIVFGGGMRSALSTPMLGAARIEVRTPDMQTAQRRLIHEEQVDAGGIIDSHGCLDQTADLLPRCVQQGRSDAEGFIHVAGADGPPGFDVQLLVTGEHIGVRQQAGAERRIVVTWWSRLITAAWLQIFAAWLLGLSALAGLWPLLAREEPSQAK